MTKRIGNAVFIETEPPETCTSCGEAKECRPAGVDGARVCHPCALKNPRAMDDYMRKLLGTERAS